MTRTLWALSLLLLARPALATDPAVPPGYHLEPIDHSGLLTGGLALLGVGGGLIGLSILMGKASANTDDGAIGPAAEGLLGTATAVVGLTLALTGVFLRDYHLVPDHPAIVLAPVFGPHCAGFTGVVRF